MAMIVIDTGHEIKEWKRPTRFLGLKGHNKDPETVMETVITRCGWDRVAAVEDSRDSGYDEGTDSREYEAGANHDRVHAVNHRLGA